MLSRKICCKSSVGSSSRRDRDLAFFRRFAVDDLSDLADTLGIIETGVLARDETAEEAADVQANLDGRPRPLLDPGVLDRLPRILIGVSSMLQAVAMKLLFRCTVLRIRTMMTTQT